MNRDRATGEGALILVGDLTDHGQGSVSRDRETSVGSFIGSVVLHTGDSELSAAFWRDALGYVSAEDNAEFLVPPEWAPPSRTRHDHGDGMHVHVDRGDKNHLDLWVSEGDSLESEVERLVALGAKRVKWDYPDEADHVVLADPDGNLFCVVA